MGPVGCHSCFARHLSFECHLWTIVLRGHGCAKDVIYCCSRPRSDQGSAHGLFLRFIKNSLNDFTERYNVIIFENGKTIDFPWNHAVRHRFHKIPEEPHSINVLLQELTAIFHAVQVVSAGKEGVGIMNIRKKTVQGLMAGDTFVVKRTFTETDMHMFADITRDYNPVHFNENFAAAKKFNGKICHGLLAASIITEIGGQIGWLASGMDFRFKKPVYFNDTITCHFTITSIDENGRAVAEAVYKNQKDTVVLEAVITGILPNMLERDILSQMMDEGDPTNKLTCRKCCA